MMESRLKELKDNHEFRKGEGWEITTLSEDVDWLIEQAEKVERYEKALETIIKDSELFNTTTKKTTYSYPGKVAKKALEG
jgi:hypothetical protein